jgi:cyanophycinase
MSMFAHHSRRPLLAAFFAGALAIASVLPAGAVEPASALVPIGAGYSETTLEGFAQTVIDHAGGDVVQILVVTSAYGDSLKERAANIELAQQRTDQIDAACEAVVTSAFADGCDAILLHLFDYGETHDPANSALFYDPETDGAYILGGDQDLAMHILANSPAEAAMEDAASRGAVFGGNSAGAAVESINMIADYTAPGWPYNALERDKIIVWWADPNDTPDPTERGLSFGSQRSVIEQHLYARGRMTRLLNVVAQSDDRFGGSSLLGIGADEDTGVTIANDATAYGVFGATSVSVVDFEAADATHAWVGPNETLSARDVLLHVLAPGAAGYDMVNRSATLGGSAVPYVAATPWSPSVLAAPGAGTLMLGGDLLDDPHSPVFGEIAAQARTTGQHRILVVTAGYRNVGQGSSSGNDYAKALADAGWKESADKVEVIAYGPNGTGGALPLSRLQGAAAVIFVGGNQARMAPALADPAFTGFVRTAIAQAPLVVTDRAMTAVMGDRYATNADPTSDTVEPEASASFLAGHTTFAPGLAIVDRASFEPRLTLDQRWGRLVAAGMTDAGDIAFGISERTALVLEAAGATVSGERSVIALDGRAATFQTGDNGAMTALNTVLDLFATGETVDPGA